ncbi:hypothetical protein CASFOL_038861 [Castilleja foliolosa]|uniref:Uncharacterized protein n=1 Tax=Castilleja foliolosa TaxID=1961234 RepID=A0ABD3BIP1_9LAMI
MANIISMAMTTPKRPTNNNHFIFDKKTSNKAYIAFTNGATTGLTRSCSSFQLKALQNCDDQIITDQRRSGNYTPPIWDFDFIQSTRSEYKEERHMKRVSELISQVKTMLNDEIIEVVRQLEFIDELQRLGISYHFEYKINQILNRIYVDGRKNYDPTDLYSTALRFRLLRQHGFIVSQDVFDSFKNEDGGFKASLRDDTKGLLELYEASFMSTQGENTLELAKEFATKFMQKKIDDDHENIEEHFSLLVQNALDLPLNWRSARLSSRWFIINAYEKRKCMNPIVLEFAKLDFNIVQATHQQELKHISKWWKQTGLIEKLPFVRDRMVECYLFTVGGVFFEPQYGYERITITKVNTLITTLDDIFDVYGTFEELQLFNDVIQRWDIEAMDKLPNYMQICFLALNNFVDEMAFHVLKEQGVVIIPHLRKSWADLCKSYLQEAEWYNKGYTPKLEEYINNAWVSISTPTILTHAFFLVTNPIQNETIRSLYKYHNIVRCSGMILRLANDLETSPEEMNRGDVPKAIECYMNETGASVEEAREHVRFMINETWKEMNKERAVAGNLFVPEFVRIAVDFARAAQYVYQYGDGFGTHRFPRMKHRIMSLFFEPMVLDTDNGVALH